MVDLIPIPSPEWPLEFGDTGKPGVVVVHDRYGRLPFLESYAKALAKNGFYVVVPDLYTGFAAIDAEGAEHLESQQDIGFATETFYDSLALAESSREDRRVAVIGMGSGARFALDASCQGRTSAAVSYYGLPGVELPGIVPCALQFHLAEFGTWGGTRTDPYISALKENGTTVARFQYEGTTDDFANGTLPALLNPQAAALAFARTARFLQSQLID